MDSSQISDETQRRYKVAFVKSCYYQDLWVCDKTNDQVELLRTSFMRCPAIGLTEVCDAEFIIIKDFNDFTSEINKNQYNVNIYAKEKKYEGLSFLDETYHSNYTINDVSYHVDEIEWSKYDIVIAMNLVIPIRIIEAHPEILWCYYIAENNMDMNQIHPYYDILLNQDVQMKNFPVFSVGMPYTFLGPNTLENICSKIPDVAASQESVCRRGIYMEINNTEQRPVIDIPLEFQYIEYLLSEMKMELNIIPHNQNILKNMENMLRSKYFIKLKGRTIRGNSILEAISCGALIIANKNLITFKDLVLDECHVSDERDAAEKIAFFENNPEKYEECLRKQREILYTNYFRGPIDELFEKCEFKKTLRCEFAGASDA